MSCVSFSASVRVLDLFSQLSHSDFPEASAIGRCRPAIGGDIKEIRLARASRPHGFDDVIRPFDSELTEYSVLISVDSVGVWGYSTAHAVFIP